MTTINKHGASLRIRLLCCQSLNDAEACVLNIFSRHPQARRRPSHISAFGIALEDPYRDVSLAYALCCASDYLNSATCAMAVVYLRSEISLLLQNLVAAVSTKLVTIMPYPFATKRSGRASELCQRLASLDVDNSTFFSSYAISAVRHLGADE